MSSIVMVTGPQQEPIDLEDVKNHLRVDLDDDDELIMAYMIAARRTCEQIANKKLVTQTWDIWLDYFPGSTSFNLPKSLGPLQSVSFIKYTDEDNNVATYAASNYVVDANSQPGRIVLKPTAAWPGDVLLPVNGVEIQVVVGFGDDADVPEEYKQAIKLLVGHWYENRETVIVGSQANEIPMGVKSLLWLDRVVPI